MKTISAILASALIGCLTAGAYAAEKTVALSVPGMTCSACPITVKTALSRVSGVEQVTVDYPNKTATVTYDDTRTQPAALTKATADAGYPSTAKDASAQ